MNRRGGREEEPGMLKHHLCRSPSSSPDLCAPILAHPPSRSPMASGDAVAAEEARWIFVGDPDLTHHRSGALPNSIRTYKYNFFTFIPRNLFEQFRRIAYFYFLLLACLNQIPQLEVYGGFTSFLPLGIVVVSTAVKDACEDWQRHRSDAEENNRAASVLSSDGVAPANFAAAKWKHVRSGEVVRVAAGESIPCDLVLLSTSDPNGATYIQTINLDGESNLKTRYALQETASRSPDSWLPGAAAIIRCDKPNLNIYAFNGTIEIDGRRIPLGPMNVVLRGCELKNTAWIVGVAVYTGMETKVMLNNTGPPSKRSRLETQMNREIVILAATMVVMCFIVTLFAGLWLHSHRHLLDTLPYFRKADYSHAGGVRNYLYSGIVAEVVIALFKSVFSFQNVIPISLYITMELARVAQSRSMAKDKSMYHEPTDTRFQSRALNINEDLGQIGYVFSDKTGTLTENKMVFRCASIAAASYDCSDDPLPGQLAPHPTIVEGQIWKPKTTINTNPELLRLLEIGKGTDKELYARSFFLALATCNTIVPQVVSTSDDEVKLIDYQGESPDEQALVYAAAAYGFVLIERASTHVVINVLGENQRFEILGIHEFDSDRKRMSVVVGCPDKVIRLFVKGADNAMLSVINNSSNMDMLHSTEIHIHEYSSLGLRTLVTGMRELNFGEFQEWQLAYEKASSLLSGRSEALKAIALDVESNIHILGATGIEDKLQQGVPEAIELLRQAGIKVWVLTGDKQETAISIGYSCKLLTDEMTHIIINCHSKELCKSRLEDAISMSKKFSTVSRESIGEREPSRVQMALIVDGPTLVHILDSELEETLYEVAGLCDAVLCCRVAPIQKAGIVALVKKRAGNLTLSIGDGANDVAMIQMADVGIGISGQEGRQAVMASDFSMAQFRFLVPLLLVHGHWNYYRTAYMTLYSLYRNTAFAFLSYWYVFITEMSMSSPINDTNMLLFSAAYTALPTMILAIYEQDLSRGTLLKYPQLYGTGQRDEFYNFKLFVFYMIDALWQSVVLFLFPILCYGTIPLDNSSLGDIWIIAAVLLVNLHISMDVIRWSRPIFGTLCGCTTLAMICIYAIDASPNSPGFRAVNHLLGSGHFWLILLVTLMAGLLPRFSGKVFLYYLFPSDIRIARELEKAEKCKHRSLDEAPRELEKAAGDPEEAALFDPSHNVPQS